MRVIEQVLLDADIDEDAAQWNDDLGRTQLEVLQYLDARIASLGG